MEKLYFCAECGILTPLTQEPDEGDVCSNCNCDLFTNDPIIGQFEKSDARHLRELDQ